MFSIGVDLGGTKIAAGIVDDNGNLIVKDSMPTLAERPYTEIIRDTAALAMKVCSAANLSLKEIKGLGLGSPGIVDSGNGVVVFASNVNFDRAPVRDELGKYFSFPVFISNDANCAALGETVGAGAARDRRNVILVTLGTGVGGGIIIDGGIYEGEHGAGAEIGHSILVVDGILCTCGRRGCWESYSSLRALVRRTEEAIRENPDSAMWDMIGHDYANISGRTAFEASKKGDAAACRVIEHYVKYLSEGLIDMVNIFRPEIILLGGGISNEGEYLLEPVRTYVKRYAFGGERTPVPAIAKAALGNDAGIIGAAMLVFKNGTAEGQGDSA